MAYHYATYGEKAPQKRAAARAWAKANPARVLETVKRYRLAQERATPSWASIDKMIEMYEARIFAEEFFGVPIDVDHVVPLQGRTVCGLHCEHNLQLLPRYSTPFVMGNNQKRNRVWPDMPEQAS